MRIRMIKTACGPDLNLAAGAIVDLPAELAARLLADHAGVAVDPETVETALRPAAPERAMRPEGETTLRPPPAAVADAPAVVPGRGRRR